MDWTQDENDAIVADYFSMLEQELAGKPYNKAGHNREIRDRLRRAKGSVEFKHQNISFVLKSLGECWIEGYKPRSNIQMSLADAVSRWLSRNQTWLQRPTRSSQLASHTAESDALWVGPPPTHSNAAPPNELAQMMLIAQKFDVAGRDARNRALGRAGEHRVLLHERTVLSSAGRDDLARSVRWVSDIDGDGAGYDILSFLPDGTERLVEVKTTNGWERTPFHISRNELAVANSRRDQWYLVRLWNFAKEPRAFEMRPPLEAHVELTPTSFLASFDNR